jgi:hypothetical protein
MKNRSCLLSAGILIVVLLLLLAIGPDLLLNCYYAIYGPPDSAALSALRDSTGFTSLVVASKIAQWLTWLAVPAFILGGIFALRGKPRANPEAKKG